MSHKSVPELPFPLSNEQRDIVCSEGIHIKVEAAAGTGKTETIARKILYLITQENIEPRSIVAFTFTNRAADEMKSRVYKIASEIGDKNLVERLGEIYIGTMHSYCKKVLEDQFSYDNYTLFNENKEIAFLLRIGWDLGIDNYEHGYTLNL
jgi:DNA helicase-2/ATP-dependent DNA helicase PcrA